MVAVKAAPRIAVSTAKAAMLMVRELISLRPVPDPGYLCGIVAAVRPYLTWPSPLCDDAAEVLRRLTNDVCCPTASHREM